MSTLFASLVTAFVQQTVNTAFNYRPKRNKIGKKTFFTLQSLQSLTKRQSLNNLSFLQNFPTQCKITLIKSPNEGQRGLSKLDKNSEGCIFYYIHVYLVAQTKVNTIQQRTGESCIFQSFATNKPTLPPPSLHKKTGS